MSITLYQLLHRAKQVKTDVYFSEHFYLKPSSELNNENPLINDRVVFSNDYISFTYKQLLEATHNEETNIWFVKKHDKTVKVTVYP